MLRRGRDLLELMCKLKQNSDPNEICEEKNLFINSIIEKLCLHTRSEEQISSDANKEDDSIDEILMVNMLVVMDRSVIGDNKSLNYQEPPIPHKCICNFHTCNYTSEKWIDISQHMDIEHPLMYQSQKKSIHESRLLWPDMHKQDKNSHARPNFPKEIALTKAMQTFCDTGIPKYKKLKYISINFLVPTYGIKGVFDEFHFGKFEQFIDRNHININSALR
ncbi:MAG: hypothetical protein QS721_06020 [Candidatus Endonucleobacter sp. (ex Gigantidas childressi)]|nr:hypothetical protein [Candidatus Endonucleobacter sp. (ex Gigantidas childressi)]